jgi:hypothetical protein
MVVEKIHCQGLSHTAYVTKETMYGREEGNSWGSTKLPVGEAFHQFRIEREGERGKDSILSKSTERA